MIDLGNAILDGSSFNSPKTLLSLQSLDIILYYDIVIIMLHEEKHPLSQYVDPFQ